MTKLKGVTAKLADGTEAEFSVFGHVSHLLMLHSELVSCQWHLDDIAIMPNVGGGTVQIGIQSLGSESYQSWFFKESELDSLSKFFKELGFPFHLPIPIEKLKEGGR